MKKSLASWLLVSIASISQATSAPERLKYGFATKDYLIEMKITFLDRYAGQRLAFYSSVDPGKALCLPVGAGTAGTGIDRFVGAVAILSYSVKLANGATPSVVSIREEVTVSAQSSGLPERPPFSMTQKLERGIGSDIQAFGYDEGPLRHAERTSMRRQATATWWRLCRQELYVDQETKPFAIVEWKHTLDRIRIVRIYAPPP